MAFQSIPFWLGHGVCISRYFSVRWTEACQDYFSRVSALAFSLQARGCAHVYPRTEIWAHTFFQQRFKPSPTASLASCIVCLITSHLRPNPRATTSCPAAALLLPSTCSVLALWLRSQPQLEPQHHISPPDTLQLPK